MILVLRSKISLSFLTKFTTKRDRKKKKKVSSLLPFPFSSVLQLLHHLIKEYEFILSFLLHLSLYLLLNWFSTLLIMENFELEPFVSSSHFDVNFIGVKKVDFKPWILIKWSANKFCCNICDFPIRFLMVWCVSWNVDAKYVFLGIKT